MLHTHRWAAQVPRSGRAGARPPVAASVGGPRATRRCAWLRVAAHGGAWRRVAARGCADAWLRGCVAAPLPSPTNKVRAQGAARKARAGRRRRLERPWMAHGERLTAREPAERPAVGWSPMRLQGPWPRLHAVSSKSERTPSRQSVQSLAQRRLQYGSATNAARQQPHENPKKRALERLRPVKCHAQAPAGERVAVRKVSAASVWESQASVVVVAAGKKRRTGDSRMRTCTAQRSHFRARACRAQALPDSGGAAERTAGSRRPRRTHGEAGETGETGLASAEARRSSRPHAQNKPSARRNPTTW